MPRRVLSKSVCPALTVSRSFSTVRVAVRNAAKFILEFTGRTAAQKHLCASSQLARPSSGQGEQCP